MTTRTTIVGLAAGAALTLGGIALFSDDAPDDRQAQVAQRGGEVMPFDLEATTHRFIKRRDGGVQAVVADATDDRQQVRLIREHLRKEAAAFRRGDFDDPAAIHGEQMPGIATLRESGDTLTIRYRDRPDGAELRFTTSRRPVRAALHAWFDAQVADHGGHAEGH